MLLAGLGFLLLHILCVVNIYTVLRLEPFF